MTTGSTFYRCCTCPFTIPFPVLVTAILWAPGRRTHDALTTYYMTTAEEAYDPECETKDDVVMLRASNWLRYLPTGTGTHCPSEYMSTNTVRGLGD